jgi:hypothetical protein
MKALLLTAAIIAAVAVTAPAALAKQQGYRYLGDTLSTELQPAPTRGINIITDTLGGTGQPLNSIAANDERHFGAGSSGPASLKPYIYGGAPPAVAKAGSGFYRAHLSPPVTTSAGDGFNWGDAGLGAVTGFGALFLLAGTAMLARRRTTLAV